MHGLKRLSRGLASLDRARIEISNLIYDMHNGNGSNCTVQPVIRLGPFLHVESIMDRMHTITVHVCAFW